MSNAHHMPAEGFRTAAYLEARARLDAGKAARKTNRTNVQCTPPNVKCGGRCIPPSWDCRLKGQGADPHLRAVKTDPLGGLANIQRGVSRITKGVTKGSFSEVEGGKRAVIRGVVKVAPGNLQQKKELQTKLEESTRSIGIGLAVVTGGLGVHALLMKTDTFGYRNGAGANINNAVRLGVSRVLDATPVIGANRARVRSAVQTGIEAQLTRQANPVSAALTNQLARTRVTGADTDARTNLVRALTTVNDDHRARGAQADFDAWNRDHQRAFWSATRREDNQEASVFARPATNEFLARQFNLSGDDVLTTRAVKDAVQRQIAEHKSNLFDLAQQQGFRVKTARGGARYMEGADQRTFIQGVVRGAVPGGGAATPLRAQLTRDLEETLRRTPKGRADEIYRDTFRSFNDFYTRQASATENAYSASRLTREMRRTGIEQTLLDGRQVRAAYVLGLVRPGSEVRGPAHAELALREYHAREVVGTPRNMYAITDRLATAAASEIEGRPVSLAEAFGVLERAGFTGAVRQSGPPSRTFGRRGQYSSEGEAAYALMRQNPGMTLAAARRAVRRRRSDASPELVRTAAYLAARADLQEGRLGKPCGASHIPKAHECRKGQGAAGPDTPTKRAGTTQVAAASTEPPSPRISKYAVAALGLGAATIATALAIDFARYSRNNYIPATGNMRSVLKAQLKKDKLRVKDSDIAMRNYYDAKVAEENWRLGEVCYYKPEGDKMAHFGIYIGKRDGAHQFVGVGANHQGDKGRIVGEVGVTAYGPSNGKYDKKPVVWAKAPEHVQPPRGQYSDTEIVRRALRLVGKPYNFNLAQDNCEAWASMIVSGVPHSRQVERFTAVTKSILKASNGVYRSTHRGGYTGMQMSMMLALEHNRYIKDAANELPDPAVLLHPFMSELEAMSVIKNYLMLLISGLSPSDGPA